MKILTVVGARPQFIKAAAVSRVIQKSEAISEVILHTGQHYDKNMSDVFFKELNIPQPKYNLGIGSYLHGKQTAKMLEGIEEVLINEKPDWVLTYGDTNSTLAGALAAAKLHIPTAHVEAGLRSYNRKMPEEINRITADHLSDLLLAPTENALGILSGEGLASNSVNVGDVMFDSILYFKKKVGDSHKIQGLDLPDKYHLATIHRPENTDEPARLRNIFEAFSELESEVIIPLHPRTQKNLAGIKYGANVKIISPVSYKSMIYLLKKCSKVFTDSGGLQKEAFFMKKPCITLRDQTEWIETLNGNWNFIVAADKQKILDCAAVNSFEGQKNYFGDGAAAEKIIKELIRI